MKKMRVITSFVAVGVLAGAFFVTLTGASQSAEQQAEKAVKHYLNSAKSGNVVEMMKYTKDVRYADDATKQKAYERIVKDPMEKAELLDLDVTSDTEGTATVLLTTRDTGTHQLTLPVVNDGGQWKILIDRSQSVEKNDIK